MNGECKEDKVEEKAKDVGDQNTEVLNNVENVTIILRMLIKYDGDSK